MKAENPTATIATNLVTTSASGFDPDSSPQAALLQVAGVAQARNMPKNRIRKLVNQHSEGRMLGRLGEPRENVLNLNRALDRWGGG